MRTEYIKELGFDAPSTETCVAVSGFLGPGTCEPTHLDRMKRDSFILQWLAELGRLIRQHRQATVFSLCCLFVAAVSVHDASLIVTNHQVISDVEQNPVGKWLLGLQGGGVWLFVLVKLAGTALVGAVLVTLYQRFARVGLISAIVLSGFQFALLCFLTFA